MCEKRCRECESELAAVKDLLGNMSTVMVAQVGRHVVWCGVVWCGVV